MVADGKGCYSVANNYMCVVIPILRVPTTVRNHSSTNIPQNSICKVTMVRLYYLTVYSELAL